MAFTERLHESNEYQAVAGQTGEGSGQSTTSSSAPEAVAPVLQLEKGDLEFWMQVATVFLLFLIYRELARGNGRAVAQDIARGASA